MADDVKSTNEEQQENSSIGNVNQEADGSSKNVKHRAVFSLPTDTRYKSDENPNGWVPYENEAFVDKDANFYVWALDENGNKVKKSKTKELDDIITNLKDLGIIQNAEAFRLDGKIYNFVFNNDKMVCRLNTELDFFSEYQYYSIRKIETNPITGDYIYITGLKDTTGDVEQEISHMANISTIDGKSIPSPARMLNTCENGKRYIVDFYDGSRYPVASKVFYAREVFALDYSMAPEMAIKDLVVTTDRPYKDGCFVYQNEDIDNLIIRCGVLYADGATRDITEERDTTRRLVYDGIDNIDTSKLTPGDGTPQIINIFYYMSTDNSQPILNDDVTLEKLNEDPNTIVLKKELKVYVTEDIYDAIIDLTLQGYKKANTTNVSDIYQMKVFANYASANMRDLTPVMNNERFQNSSGFVYNKETECLESSRVLSTFVIDCKIPQGRGNTTFNKKFNCEFTEQDRRLKILSSTGGFDSKDTYMFTLFNPTNRKMRLIETVSLNNILENYALKYGLQEGEYIKPTHCIVRSAMKPSVIYSGSDLVDVYAPLTNANGIIPYIIPDNNLILEDMALLVEFYYIETDPESGARTDIKLCKIQRTYAKSTTASLE